MRTLWFVIWIVAASGSHSGRQASAGEPPKLPGPTSDPFRGKAPGELRDDNSLKLKLVWCPPGFLTMENFEIVATPASALTDEPRSASLPKPSRTQIVVPAKVYLTRGFWLGQFEVTQAEWTEIMKTAPWKGDRLTRVGAEFPATKIAWNDAVEFCRVLTDQERQAGRLPNEWEYTLPTDAQWERACRARTETRFCCGDDDSKLVEYAWFDNHAKDATDLFPHRGGQKKPNPWGLYDMHGNVSEWCRDVFARTVPGGRDPEVKSPDEPGSTTRVIRGGCCFDFASGCRSANRNWLVPSYRCNWIGFRVALSPLTAPQITESTAASADRPRGE